MSFKDYYSVLGLKETASPEEVKSAYRKLSLKFHPDKNNGDAFLEEMFKNINDANEVLSNPSKRSEYDNSIKQFSNSINKSTTRASDIYIDDIKAVFDNLKEYFEKEKIANDKFLEIKIAEYIPVPKHFTIPKFLFSILVLLGLWVFFKPSATIDDVTVNENYEWVTNQDAEIYLRADFNSEKIGSATNNTGFNSIKETKYFIRIEFENGNGTIKKGYILKDKLTHKEASP